MSITTEPTGQACGARVRGVALNEPLSPKDVAEGMPGGLAS